MLLACHSCCHSGYHSFGCDARLAGTLIQREQMAAFLMISTMHCSLICEISFALPGLVLLH